MENINLLPPTIEFSTPDTSSPEQIELVMLRRSEGKGLLVVYLTLFRWITIYKMSFAYHLQIVISGTIFVILIN